MDSKEIEEMMIKDVDGFFEKHEKVIYTPCIKTRFSVDCKKFTTVFGVCSNNSTSVQEYAQ